MAEVASTIDALSERLEFRRDLIVRAETFGGRLGFVIEDSLSGKFFQIGETECRFLRQLDGRKTLQQVIAQFSSSRPGDAFSQREALVLLRWASDRALLAGGENSAAAERSRKNSESKASSSLFNPFFIRLPLQSPHQNLQSIARWLGPLFSATGFFVFAAVWISLITYAVPRAQDIFRWESVRHPQNWLGLFGIWLGLKLWHELGHAVACRRFGGEIRSAGIALVCFAPVAYIDATSAWRISSKWQRILVSAAGIYFEGWAAALAILVAALLRDEFSRTWASHVALVAGGQTLLVNANPLVRFDGYYILADLLEFPNLHALSRQTAINAVRRLSGDTQALDAPLVGKRGNFPIAYSVAAGLWRLCLSIGGVSLFLAQQETLGVPLAWLLATLWLALPIWMMRRNFAWICDWKPQPFRLVCSAAITLLALIGGGQWLSQPAIFRAEGVVEYSPMTVLRAPSAGFVREVFVENNEHVAAGTPLAVLQNEEVEYEVSDFRLQVAQSKARIQTLGAQQQLAKRSNEEANLRSLETQLKELEGKLAALTIRAPHSGRVIARNIDQLQGRYLAAGDQIAIVGGDETLHVVAVVSQHEMDAVNQLGLEAQINFGASGRPPSLAESVRFEPAAQTVLPHEALSGVNGGPVAVRESAERSADGKAVFEPLAPVFVAYIQLPPSVASSVYSGERSTIRFTSPSYSRAIRFRDMARRWFQQL